MKTKIKYQINEKLFMREIEKIYYRDKKNRYINFRDLLRPYVELENRLKALEEKFSTIDSEDNQNYITNKTNV